jgi:hypothetical protein
MTNPIIRIHDTELNEVIDREMTDEEFAAYEEQRAADEATESARVADAVAKASLLERLGISEEEAKLLLK